ncbi:MAG TPA: hypothetical protein DEA44_02155 [Firmicutes bacterium]|nr:hypothetical protein [Bacillota bacterium]
MSPKVFVSLIITDTPREKQKEQSLSAVMILQNPQNKLSLDFAGFCLFFYHFMEYFGINC